MVEILRDLRPLRPEQGQPVFPNLDGRRITPKTFRDTWKRCWSWPGRDKVGSG